MWSWWMSSFIHHNVFQVHPCTSVLGPCRSLSSTPFYTQTIFSLSLHLCVGRRWGCFLLLVAVTFRCWERVCVRKRCSAHFVSVGVESLRHMVVLRKAPILTFRSFTMSSECGQGMGSHGWAENTNIQQKRVCRKANNVPLLTANLYQSP